MGLTRGRCGNVLSTSDLPSFALCPTPPPTETPQGVLALWVPPEWSHSWLGWGLFSFFGSSLFPGLPPLTSGPGRLLPSGFPSPAPCPDFAAGILSQVAVPWAEKAEHHVVSQNYQPLVEWWETPGFEQGLGDLRGWELVLRADSAKHPATHFIPPSRNSLKTFCIPILQRQQLVSAELTCGVSGQPHLSS